MVRAGYKQTEVGEIPEDWLAERISENISEISMGPFGSDIKVSNFVSDGVPVLSGANLVGSRLIDGFKNFVTPKKAKSLKKAVARRGDVVVTHRGTLGQISYISQDSEYEEYVISQSQFRVKFSDEINPHWISLYFLSDVGSASLLEGKGHTGVPAIAQATTTFRKFYIPKPEKLEQDLVVKAISDVDGLIGALEKQIAKKRDIKTATMQQLLTGKKRLPGYGEGKGYKQTELGLIPEDWEVKALDQIADVIDPHPSHRAPAIVTGGVPFLGIGDLDENGNIIKTKLRPVDDSVLTEHRARYNLGENLIALGRVASIGKVIRLRNDIGSYALSPTMGVIRPRQIDYNYLIFALSSAEITSQFLKIMSGSTRSSVGMNVLRELQIVQPDKPREAEAIGEVLSGIDNEVDVLNTKLAKTKAIKQGMMQELLTGRTRLI